MRWVQQGLSGLPLETGKLVGGIELILSGQGGTGQLPVGPLSDPHTSSRLCFCKGVSKVLSLAASMQSDEYRADKAKSKVVFESQSVCLPSTPVSSAYGRRMAIEAHYLGHEG